MSREDKRLVCANGHSFDLAGSGYLNLLQPQERRSKRPGDSGEAVAARRRLHDLGVTRALLEEIGEMLKAGSGDAVLDAGCGEGFYLGELAAAQGFDGHGVDISVAAVNLAARRYPGCEWIVGNADRVVPYSDGSFSRVMSITGRMNAAEFRRVLPEDGRLVVAVASPEDLIELRGVGKDRVPGTVEAFAKEFTLGERRRVEARVELNAEAVRDVLVSVYRPLGAETAVGMRVTFSLDLMEFFPICM